MLLNVRSKILRGSIDCHNYFYVLANFSVFAIAASVFRAYELIVLSPFGLVAESNMELKYFVLTEKIKDELYFCNNCKKVILIKSKQY